MKDCAGPAVYMGVKGMMKNMTSRTEAPGRPEAPEKTETGTGTETGKRGMKGGARRILTSEKIWRTIYDAVVDSFADDSIPECPQ